MTKFLSGLLLLFYFTTLVASQDDAFIAARKAYQTGNINQLTTYTKQLQQHVLASYVEYYQLRLQLRQADPATIKAFLAKYPNSVVADRLRSAWLINLGKQQQWSLFAEQYPKLVNTNTELLCYSLQQRLFANDKNVLIEARPLWFTENSMPNSCTPIFNALMASGSISTEDVWTRIRLTLKAGNTNITKYINRHLPSDQALDLAKLNSASKNPLRYLEQQQQNKIKTRADRELALFAMLKLLHSDTNQAVANWSKIKPQLPVAEQSYFYGKLAYRAALRHDARALNWFLKATKLDQSQPRTDSQRAWKVRAALRSENWTALLESIDKLTVSEQQIDSWRYWKARALKETAKTSEANALFISLIPEYSFYGQLAREELGIELTIPAKLSQSSQEEITSMQQMPGIQRALLLFQLDLRSEAVREWNWAIRGFTDTQLLTAAEVAYQHNIYDRAIHTAGRTTQQNGLHLHFLAPYRQQLQIALQQHPLDEALVYGLMHQESRFVANISSHAGAIGLMQVMPATAKWIANRLEMDDYHRSLVVEIDTNLKLGSYYLEYVLGLFDDQPLLALAAYNAGPGRAKRWRDARLLEGAIYAETIPYRETRDYVKKVLYNTMIYAKILEHGAQAPTLKQRLGVIEPK